MKKLTAAPARQEQIAAPVERGGLSGHLNRTAQQVNISFREALKIYKTDYRRSGSGDGRESSDRPERARTSAPVRPTNLLMFLRPRYIFQLFPGARVRFCVTC